MAAAIVSVVIRKLTNLVAEESELFGKVRDEVDMVMVELKEVQNVFNRAEHQEQAIKVVHFLHKVYHVEDAIESFVIAHRLLKRMGFVKKHTRIFVMANESKVSRKVSDKMDYFEDICRLKSKIKRFIEDVQQWKDRITSMAPVQRRSSNTTRWLEQSWKERNAYYVPKKEETIFKKDVAKLVTQLSTNKPLPLQIICVYGKSGTGKAAHVKAIYYKLEVQKMFGCYALVFVQSNWSVRNLVMAILQRVTDLQGNEKLTDENLIGRLYGCLKGQKYLFVIVGIKSNLFEGLKGALPDMYNGSRVVITTPSEEASLFTNASNSYHFKPLDVDEGWKFFANKVRGLKGSPFSDDFIENMKDNIAESCEGTPLRISMLVGLLSRRRMVYEEWSNVFKELQFATKVPSFDIMTFCYNDLPLHLRSCFLYLGLFRKGFEIPVRRLFRLWLAEGFVEPLKGILLEDQVEGYLEELVKRNMVVISKRRSDDSPKKCRMIDALHDFFLPRAVEIGLFHLHQWFYDDDSNVAEQRFGVRRVVEYTNMSYGMSVGNQNMRSYISFNDQKFLPVDEVGTFLDRFVGPRGFGLLRVLDLEDVNRPRLPESLGNLLHLRYLGLRWTFLEALPSSLGKLLYLETLDIKHTLITTLPNSIWNMKHLRHLCLNGARLDIPAQANKHGALNQLHTLWDLFVDEKIARKIGLTLSRMTNIRKLDLTTQTSSTVITTTVMTATTTTTTTSQSSSYEEIGLLISKLTSLQSLRLKSKDKFGRPSELIIKPFSSLTNLSQLYLLGHLHKSLAWYQFPPGLKVLTLSVSKLDEDPMHILSQLPSLMILRLLAASYVGTEMHCPENGFPVLRVLKLWKLEKLKVLTVHEGSMQNLHTLELRCCIELKELPGTLLQIQSFDKLILTNMPKSFVDAIRQKKKKHTKIVENEWDLK